MPKDPKKRDENAKDPSWKVPVELPGVQPEDYELAPEPGKQACPVKPSGSNTP